MTIRWGKRSTGGVVKAGYGGWSLTLDLPPRLDYTNPATGDGLSVSSWNVVRAYRGAKRRAELQQLKRVAVEVGFLLDRSEEISADVFRAFAERTGIELPDGL